MKKLIVIYNPNSGHTLKKENIPKYKNIIESYGYEVEFIGTKYKGHAKEIVSHAKNVDIVMSMGGDGTLNEIVCGNLSRKNRIVMAHIPVGTTNDVGVMFGYSKNIEKNIHACLSGEVMNMDIPKINGRPFVYVAGFGKFMDIPYDTPRKLKKRLGHLAYLLNGAKDFFFRKLHNYEIEYEVNGKTYNGLYSLGIISSANRIAGMNNFYKDIKLDDDTFEVLMCSYTKKKDIVRAFGLLLATHSDHVTGIESHKTNKMILRFKEYPKKAWCIDGESLEIRTKEYVIENERNIKMLIPQKNLNKLFLSKNK